MKDKHGANKWRNKLSPSLSLPVSTHILIVRITFDTAHENARENAVMQPAGGANAGRCGAGTPARGTPPFANPRSSIYNLKLHGPQPDRRTAQSFPGTGQRPKT